MTRRSRRAGILALLLVLGAPPAAEAQQPITSSRYRVDFFSGSVLGSPRVIGLAGAYGAVAEGAVGIPFNPAAVAHRLPHSDTWWDWDITFDYLDPGTFQTRDFDWDNNRRSLRADIHIFQAGGLLQFYNFGLGVHQRSQWIDFQDSSGATQRARLTLLQATLGYALWRHQVILGAGARIGGFDVNKVLQPGETDDSDFFSTNLLGVEAGVLIRPERLPLRFSASFGFGFLGGVSKECELSCPAGFFLPSQVSVPWELRLGAAWRLARTPYNRPFRVKPRPRPRPRAHPRPLPRDPLQSRPRPLPGVEPGAGSPPLPPPLPGDADPGSGAATPASPRPAPAVPASPRPAPAVTASSPPPARAREPAPPTEPRAAPQRAAAGEPEGGERYLLVTAEVVVYGPTRNAVGLDGFLDQLWLRAGRRPTASAHLGVESEVWRRRMRLAIGTYFEPSRADDYIGRVHGTLGFALRLFDFTLWGKRSLSISGAFDAAIRYTNLSVSLGISRWH